MTSPEESNADWFEKNKSLLAALSNVLEKPSELAKRKAAHLTTLIRGVTEIDTLTEPEHRAALLLGRGCTVAQTADLTGLSISEITALEAREEFLEVCDTYRMGWINEKVSVIQQSIDEMDLTTPQLALSVMSALRGLMQRRDKLVKARAEYVASMMRSEERIRSRRRPVSQIQVEEVDEVVSPEETEGSGALGSGAVIEEVDEEDVE